MSKVKMNIYLEQDLKTELQNIADEYGIKPSHLISMWIKKYWDNQDKVDKLLDELLEAKEEIDALKDRIFDLEEQ